MHLGDAKLEGPRRRIFLLVPSLEGGGGTGGWAGRQKGEPNQGKY
jgi:hypothetical protein